jgi:hypothetical protein
MSLYSRLEQRLEAQSDDAGPLVGTYSTGRLFMIWLAANLVVTTLLTGTLFVPDVNYGLVLLLIVLGTVIGAAVLVAVGTIGRRTGLPTMALTRGPVCCRSPRTSSSSWAGAGCRRCSPASRWTTSS